jgi:hypothetical protein
MDQIRLEPEVPYPGPVWDPFYWYGKYPAIANTGDIYTNRYVDPPLYYVFHTPFNCEPTTLEEIEEWVAGGLMSPLTLVLSRDLPRQQAGGPSSGAGSESAEQTR